MTARPKRSSSAGNFLQYPFPRDVLSNRLLAAGTLPQHAIKNIPPCPIVNFNQFVFQRATNKNSNKYHFPWCSLVKTEAHSMLMNECSKCVWVCTWISRALGEKRGSVNFVRGQAIVFITTRLHRIWPGPSRWAESRRVSRFSHDSIICLCQVMACRCSSGCEENHGNRCYYFERLLSQWHLFNETDGGVEMSDYHY